MGLPEHVLQTLNELKISNMDKYKTLEKLCYCREERKVSDPSQSDYEIMWKSLEKHESKRMGEFLSNKWVESLLDDVISFQQVPTYLKISQKARNELWNELESHSNALVKIFDNNDYHQHCIINDGLFTDGFLEFRENENGELIEVDTLDRARFSIGEVIKVFADFLKNDIQEAYEENQNRESLERRLFVRKLGQRNLNLYDKVLYKNIAIIIYSLYGVFHSDGAIKNMMSKKH